MTAITATNLTKRYGRVNAVNDLSFEIGQGEIVGFLGPNGAGKTTTLRMLAGLIRPSQGKAQILGRDVPAASLLDVGTMIEEPSFYKYMSGRDNLRHAAKLHGGVKDRRIDDVLEFVSMDQAANKRVGAYSQGMRQRLGLARALLWQPKVLLLDEPTNGLDPVGIAEIRENLRTIARQGVTILISSHILAEIEKLVERIIAVEKGKLLFDGKLDELTERMDAATANYRLEASNSDDLSKALHDMNFKLTAVDGSRIQIALPPSEITDLISGLLMQGVQLTEVRRETDNLEGAYLRLLREDGRPS